MMTLVDPGTIGECDARTQGGSIVSLSGRPRTRQRAAERGRATQRSLCESLLCSCDGKAAGRAYGRRRCPAMASTSRIVHNPAWQKVLERHPGGGVGSGQRCS